MGRPEGIVRKTKDNSKKKYQQHEEWMAGKKIGRPQQQFNPETNQWSKIMEPRKVTE